MWAELPYEIKNNTNCIKSFAYKIKIIKIKLILINTLMTRVARQYIIPHPIYLFIA